MLMPTRYNTFLNESLQNNNKILPRCRSLKLEDICSAISEEIILLVGTDIAFMVKN